MALVPFISFSDPEKPSEDSKKAHKQAFRGFKFDETVSATFYGRSFSKTRCGMFCVSAVGSLGFALLLSKWIPKLRCTFLTVACPLSKATHVLVVNSFGQTELIPTERRQVFAISEKFRHFVGNELKDTFVLTFDYRRNRFVLDPHTGLFVSIYDLLPLCLPTADHNINGLSEERHKEIKMFIGPNIIDIHEKTGLQILVGEILHPFNVFQATSFLIWIFEEYYIYAFIILLMAISSAAITVLETKNNLDKMRKMTRFVCRVKVLRGEIIETSSEDLVPGDIMVLDDSIELVPCDGILVNGDAIVDESMLTGETVPVTKVDIKDDAYTGFLQQGVEDSRFFLFSGTRLLRSRPRHCKPPLILVTKTGFLTTKGSLVQSILFPRPNNFRFYRDSMVFIGIMAVIAALGFAVAVVNFIFLGASVYLIISRGLDVITVVLPPALPATMAIGTVFAIKRLEKEKIFCISPPSKIEIFCFDKTGTLTEEGLEIHGVLPVVSETNFVGKFTNLIASLETLQSLEKLHSNDLLKLMSTCHSLRRIHGRLLGDSLDLRMFEFTRWELEELLQTGEAIVPTVVRPPGSQSFDFESFVAGASQTSTASQEMGIIRQFDFCSKLRRMSVVARKLSEDCLYTYVKGSPESLLDICLPESIPKDYNNVLAYYAHHGYRVIGCARKACPAMSWLKAQKMTREQAECGLTFLGFIIFENRLKPETAPTISSLRAAQITSVMATGDNILTAISVGRASGLIREKALVFYPALFSSAKTSREVLWQCVDDVDLQFDSIRLSPRLGKSDYSLAVTGEFFEWVKESLPLEYRKKILSKCLIYARMSPHQKQLLVELLQQRPSIVGFCGDGANDCGALKAADVGMSLSQAEASIAAPFTSKIQDISCVLTLLKEGRASLVTSFCCFKYMSLYSMIQFTTLIFLYSFGSTLSDGQFVYIDLLLIVPLCILMSRYTPAKELVARQPTAKLISAPILVAILGHILIQALFQTAVYFVLAQPLKQGWVLPTEDETNTLNPSTSLMFFFSAFLYIGIASIFSTGKPFRQRVYWPFVLYAITCTLSTLVFMFYPVSVLKRWLYLTDLPLSSKICVFLSALLYYLVAIVFDRIVAPLLARWARGGGEDGPDK